MSTPAAGDSERASEDDAQSTLQHSPQNLPTRAWATLIMFAAFVVFTSACMVNLLTR